MPSSYSRLAQATIAMSLLLSLQNSRVATGFLSLATTTRSTAATRSFLASSSRRLLSTTNESTSTPQEPTISTTNESTSTSTPQELKVPIHLAEGLFSVYKPLDWTSSNVVSYIRGILERDCRDRGGSPGKAGRSRKSKNVVRVGHGGTLDPLASGVLVIGVGKGTKELQSYLSGPKVYRASGELGFETTTLDMDPTGNVTKTAPFDHVTASAIEAAIPTFVGTIKQVPPIFSAIRKGGKRLYEIARNGEQTDDLIIEPREVTIYSIELLEVDLPKFTIQVECGGGTYIRSLIRDMGYELGSVATTTLLERTRQGGNFGLEGALAKDDWTAENIYAAIDRCSGILAAADEQTES
jgi:tRNA pseudouridine55 synthase